MAWEEKFAETQPFASTAARRAVMRILLAETARCHKDHTLGPGHSPGTGPGRRLPHAGSAGNGAGLVRLAGGCRGYLLASRFQPRPPLPLLRQAVEFPRPSVLIAEVSAAPATRWKNTCYN